MTLTPELLTQLFRAGLAIGPHESLTGEWYAGAVVNGRGGGDVGPFDSAEAALVGGVAWLTRLLRETQGERDEAWKGLRAAQAELRAEREARGEV